MTISATSGDTDAVSVSPASHTFTSSTWSTPVTFTVRGVADTDTSDESVGVSHSVTSDDAKYAAALVGTVLVSVSDTTQEQQQQQEQANQPPTVASAIADATIVNQSGTQSVSLSGVFSDADNDALPVTAASSNDAVATVPVAAGYTTLTVTAQSRGTATVTVTAQDSDGNRVSDRFTVRVEAPAPTDGTPTVAAPLADVSLVGPEQRAISLAGVFNDADGDSLVITAVSSDHSIATMWMALDRSTLTVVGMSYGTATITVTASDADGNEVSDEFEVTVSPAS